MFFQLEYTRKLKSIKAMKVIRHIHPIGQGAFYTERFVDDNNTILANVVYDCGSNKTLSNSTKKMIEFTFCEDDEIDVLFISHFDADHVNGIRTLIENKVNIRYVIMPLLAPDEIKFLSVIYNKVNGADKDIQTLVNNPKAYFGNNTIVLKVKPIDENLDNENISISLDEFEDSKLEKDENYYYINSFCKIILKDEWLYIPANFENNERSKKLSKLLNNKSIDLKSNINCLKKYKASDLKKVYNQIEGSVNGNSLLLYSGCILDNISIKCSFNFKYIPLLGVSWFKVHIQGKDACLYLGDSNLNDKNKYGKDVEDYLNHYMNKYKERIGLIQVPHHGSLLSHSKKILNFCNCKYFFLSCGIYNDYGHPSEKLIEEFNINNLYVQSVTENKDSRLIQIIEL